MNLGLLLFLPLFGIAVANWSAPGQAKHCCKTQAVYEVPAAPAPGVTASLHLKISSGPGRLTHDTGFIIGSSPGFSMNIFLSFITEVSIY